MPQNDRARTTRWTVLLVTFTTLAIIASGCSGDDSDSGGSGSGGDDTAQSSGGGDGATAAQLTAAGLWDDGPCDTAKEPLKVGMLTTFASPVLTAEDQVFALQASAVGFNQRGGANGHCVKVIVCDEKADPNTALDCVRTLDGDGIAVTVNDAVAATPGPEVGDAFKQAGIARFANSSATTADQSDLNSYPFDAGGIGTTMVMPQALLDEGIKKIATIRVDLPNVSSLIGLFDGIYGDQGADFVADIPVVAGTTDYSQFVLSAEQAGAKGVVLPLGGQEAIQVLKAAQQLGSDLTFSTSLGTLPYSDLAELGDFSEQIILNGSIPPATAADLPVLTVLLADLATSGKDVLDAENLKSSAMHSWVGLYALLAILRTAKTEDFSRANMTALIEASGPIDMLDLTADWTPNTVNPGAFSRTGNGYYAFWRWSADAKFGDQDGNLEKGSETNFVDLLCGSPLGAPKDTCG